MASEKYEDECRRKMIEQKDRYDKMKDAEGDSDLIFNSKDNPVDDDSDDVHDECL